ncbi:MAG: ATP-binding protein [Cyanobacteria bacterium J06632_3]
MKSGSFRLRIALLSVALAGGALVGFGLVAWRLIYVAKVNSLDAKLTGQLQRMTAAQLDAQMLEQTPDWWERFGDALPRELGTQVETPITLLVADARGGTLHYQVDGANLGNVPLEMGVLLTTVGQDLAEKMVAEAATTRGNATIVLTRNTSVGSWRVGVVNSRAGRGAIAVSLQTIDQDMAVIRNIFLFAIPSTLLMIAIGAWVLSGSALKPVHKLTSVIQQVTATGLDQQVPIGSADVEFVELIEVFNEMLRRLERSFKQSSRFSGDAAHELKTPLAILRGELELAMQQAEPGSKLQQSLSNLMDEVSRLSTIVRKLLLLSLADAGQMSLRQDRVDIGEIMVVLAEDIELLDPTLPVKVDMDKDLIVKGDRDLLTQVLQNLIDNGIKHNLSESTSEPASESASNRWLSIVGRRTLQTVTLTVANASQGIPEEERDRIFDRFYRGDVSRNRKREGFGLGLSLSREIARAHRGDLTLEPAEPGETAFTVTLPAEKVILPGRSSIEKPTVHT